MDPRCTRSSNESGQTLPLVVAFVLVLMIMCGAVIDIGNAYRVHQQLQASADAAAAAGASNLPSAAAAITAATKRALLLMSAPEVGVARRTEPPRSS